MLVARLIARRLGRSLGIEQCSILHRLAKETQRGHQARPVTPAPAPPAPHPGLANAAFVAWLGGLVAFALVIFNVHLFLPDGRPVAVFQLTVGAILLLEGLALAFERLPFRRLLRARSAARLQQAGRRLRWRERLAGTVLTLLGVVWVAAGVLNVIRGVVGLV